MGKEVKTNAMRILDNAHVDYTVNLYECEKFIDGVAVADLLGQNYSQSFKTIITVGKSGAHYAFLLPVDRELDFKKCAAAVNEKSIEAVHVREIQALTGYIRGGCTPVGMKKQYAVVIDKSALGHDIIIISGGRIGAQIFIAPKALISVISAITADIIRAGAT